MNNRTPENWNQTDISILLASRGRPNLVNRLFQSIIDTATHPGNIEIILYLDDDDAASHEIDDQRLRVQKRIGPRVAMGQMLNTCYGLSRGNILMITGDDNVFGTKGWDAMVKSAFTRFADGIALVYGDDLIQGRNICTSPFVSRRFCELLGGICPMEYTGEFIDSHILDLFYKIRYWGYDRIVYLEQMVVEHMHFIVGKADYDATYAERAPIEENRNRFFKMDPLRVKQAEKLVAHMAAWAKEKAV